MFDSFPPFKIAALPDLIARLAMLTTTSGRASKMHSSTPIGHVMRYRIDGSLRRRFVRQPLRPLYVVQTGS